jgi:hypothetical protein
MVARSISDTGAARNQKKHLPYISADNAVRCAACGEGAPTYETFVIWYCWLTEDCDGTAVR